MSEMMTTPSANGEAPLPRRNGSRSLLPLTWLGRACRVGYVGIDGIGIETSGTLLDWCGTGPVFSLAGARTIVSWDRLVMLELAGD
jgi:hypothetical protein